MKLFTFFFVVLISLWFGVSQSVKADTLYFQTPQLTQHLCVDTNNLPVLVIYKPNGFGSTVWFVNGTFYGTGDSVVYVPTTVGSYNFGANWNGNVEGIIIRLYSQPPAHAQFTLPYGGGSISATNDTVYMCGNSITVSVTGSIHGDTYMLWTGPGGFMSNLAPVDLTVPGMYVFERGNPCGVTRDTFYLFKVASQLPSTLTSQSVFCNQPVNTILDAGSGWLSYQWNTGATTQAIAVTAPGTYTVTVNNFGKCGVGQLTKTVMIENHYYPHPQLPAPNMVYCPSEVITINPAPGFTYDTYQWSNGATTASIQVTAPTNSYNVTVTKGSCVAVSDYQTYQFFLPPQTPEICLVTVNLSINKNQILWTAGPWEQLYGNPWYKDITHYNVYKAGSGWQLIGTVPVNQEHSFIDITSSPPTVSAVYKIAAVDGCNTESQKSPYHKTILLAVNQGANPGQIPLIWSPYQDESGNFQVDQYYIYRGDTPDNLQILDSVPGMITSYIDTGIYTQKFYQIVVIKSSGCDISPVTKKSKQIITTIRSNVTKNIVTSIPLRELEVSISPNPSPDGRFYFQGAFLSRIEVMDALGRIIMISTNPSVLDLSGFASGVYTARLSNNQGATIKKLIVQ